MMKMTIAEDKDADRIQSAAERGIVHHRKIEFAESEMGHSTKSLRDSLLPDGLSVYPQGRERG
jgi:hypothetical protein